MVLFCELKASKKRGKKPSINLYVDSATTISSVKPRYYPAKQFLVWQWHDFKNYRSYFQCRD